MKLRVNLGRHVYPMLLDVNWRAYRSHTHGPFVKGEKTLLPVAVRFVWCDPKPPSSSWNAWLYWCGGAMCWNFYIDRQPLVSRFEDKLLNKLKQLVDYYSAKEVKATLREVLR